MKIKHFVMVGVVLCMLMLTACSSEQKEEHASAQMSSENDFVSYGGANMTATPEGYYFMQAGFLYFVTADFSEATIVCDKLECVHNDSGIENYVEYNECNAYFGVMDSVINYYNGYLYVAGDHPSERGKVISKVSLDGTEKTIIYEFNGEVGGFCIYEGTAYIGNEVYMSDKVDHSIIAFPIEEPEKAEIIYETSEYPTRTMNRMKCMYEFCYFYLYDPAVLGEDSVYIKLDLDTKKAEMVYEPSYCWIELGEDEEFLQVMDAQSYDPYIWTEEYYLVKDNGNEMTQLTEEDFASIGSRDLIRNMDDEYIYFISINHGGDAVPQAEQKISVYSHDGKPAATISAAEFGAMYYILPGTDEYLFIQVQPTTGNVKDPCRYYYVDKSEFDGGTVEPHLIEIS